MKSKLVIPVLVAVATGSAWLVLSKKSENTVPNQPTPTEKHASNTSEPSEPTTAQSSGTSSNTEANSSVASSQSNVAATSPEPAKPQVAEETVATSEQDQSNPDSLTDDARAEKVREVLTAKDSGLAKYVDVQSVVCKGKTCTIEASAKGSPSSFQMAMASQLQKNPWLGSKMKFDTPDDNPGVATFQFIKE